ncbi:TPA: hypothetical protein SMI27_000831 [Serratia liquefaciens]|nr:hypothetical protein [Serratia liquefaciens]
MAKTDAERKAAQRERQRKAGVVPFELKLDQQEIDMLRENCAARRHKRAARIIRARRAEAQEKAL